MAVFPLKSTRAQKLRKSGNLTSPKPLCWVIPAVGRRPDHMDSTGDTPPTLKSPLLKGRPLLEYRREGGTYTGVDRRCREQARQSPSEVLMQIPALRVLERIPEPVLGIARDGKIVFANTAFCDMLGYTQEALLHRDGFVVAATMSMSALRRHDDPLAIAMFKDVTEQLWSTAAVEGQCLGSDKTQASHTGLSVVLS